MDNSLKRIILIDSYITGEVVEIKLGGHTVINGENGKGKTSLLRLIPLFYGERPGSLIHKGDGGHVNFASFYLPREGSYIIYEYFVRGEPKLSIFTAVSNSPDAYRRILVDSEYNPNLFLTGDGRSTLSSESLITRLNQNDVYYKLCKNTEDYKNSLLEVGTSSFSIATPGSRLTKLTALLANMFERKANFDDLAQVIQEWCMQSLKSDEKRLLTEFSINRDDLQKIINDYYALGGLDSAKNNLEVMRSNITTIEEAYLDMAAILARAVIMTESTKAEKELAEENFDKFKIKHKNKIDEYNETLIKLKDVKKSQEISHQNAEIAYSRVENTYQNFKDKGVPNYISEVVQLPGLHKTFNRIAQQIEAGNSKSKEITQLLSRQREEVREQAEKDRSIQRVQIESLNHQYDKDRNTLTENREKALFEFDEQTAIQLQPLQKIKINLETTLAIANSKLHSPQASLETQKSLEDARGWQRELEDEKSILEDEVNSVKQALDVASKAYREQDEDLTRANEKFERMDKKLTKLFDFRDTPDTLFQFLSHEVDDWKLSFGRLLDQDVLMNQRLKPVRVNAPNNAVFGVEIDLDSLNDKDLDFEKQIGQLEPQVNMARAEEQRCERALTKALEVRKAAENAYNNKLDTHRKKVRQYNQVRTQVESIEAQEKREKFNFESQLQEEIKQCQKNLSKADVEVNQFNKVRAVKRKSLLDNLKDKQNRLQNDLNTSSNIVKESILKIDTLCNNELSKLTELESRQLLDAGVDIGTMKQLELERTSLEEHLNELQLKKSEFEAYQRFMKVEYHYIDTLHEDIVSTKRALSMTLDEIQKVSSDKEVLESELQEANKNHCDNLHRLENQLSTLSLLPNLVEGIVIGSDEERIARWQHYSPADLKTRLAELWKEAQEGRQSLRSQCEPFIKNFSMHKSASCYSYFDEYVEQSWRTYETKIAAQAIIDYFDKGNHDTAISTLNFDLRFLTNIQAYKDFIDRFESRVKTFGRRINAQMDEAIRFKNLTHVSVDLEFSPRNLDNWSSIDALSNAFRIWNEEGDKRSLPDEAIIHAMRSFIGSMPSSRMASCVGDLWRHIKFFFEIVENGKRKSVSTERGLNDVASNGISYLIMIVTFLSFIDVQRGPEKVQLSWSLDELTNIDGGNIDALLELLNEKNIHMIAACPKLTYMEMQRFKFGYLFESHKGKTIIINQDLQDMDDPFEELGDVALAEV